MEERRKMTKPHITSKLRSYLKSHKNELTYATSKFTADDVTAFEVYVDENYMGKDYYSFSGKIEFKDPQKDRITDWIHVKSKIYIEEGEDNEPQFSKIEKIYLC